MSLIACRECKAEVSNLAISCPRCGCPISMAAQGLELVMPPCPAGMPAVHRVPLIQQGTPPVVPSPVFRPINTFVGIVVLVFGLWLVFGFVPDHDPHRFIRSAVDSPITSVAGAVLNGDTFYDDTSLLVLKVVGWVVAALGLAELLANSFKRTGWLAFCKKCNGQVIARKAWFRKKCEKCGSPVRVHK